MQRRDFLRSAGAAAMAPLLPMPAMAARAPAAVNEFQLGWATLLARVNNKASPELIQKWLRVNAADANGLMGELVKREVVQKTVSGSAVAVKPMYPTKAPPGFVNKSKEAAEKVADFLSDDEQTEPLEISEDADVSASETELGDVATQSDVEEIGIDSAPEVHEV